MSRPPRFPCPVHMILDAPAMHTAPGAVYRCTAILAMAYWEAECTLPVHDDITLAALCRIQPHVIRANKSAVIRALSQITPEMDKARRKLVKTYEGRYGRIEKARTISNRNRALRHKQISPSDVAFIPAARHEETSQQPAARHEASRAAQRERKGIAATSRGKQATPATAMFTDRPVIAPPEGGDDN